MTVEASPPDSDPLLLPLEVADMLRIGVQKVYFLMRDREIEHVKIGNRRRIRKSAVDAYLASLTIPPDDAA